MWSQDGGAEEIEEEWEEESGEDGDMHEGEANPGRTCVMEGEAVVVTAEAGTG